MYLLNKEKETKDTIIKEDFKNRPKRELITINKNFQVWINFKINCNVNENILFFIFKYFE